MSLASLLLRIGAITTGLLAVASLLLIGPARLAGLRGRLVPRLRQALPHLLVLGVLLVLNSQFRTVAESLSWVVGIEITGWIYGIEGDLVPWIQSFATPALTAVFSAVYVYGYVFLLIFPLLAYLALEEQTPFQETCVAYAYNYAFGLGLYVLFVAYGPRNLLPATVEPLMYTAWPESQLLVSQVNTNTNVFPSLHSSLAATVVLLSARTRATYPGLFYLSVLLAAAIMLATLYLGIHWGTDVLTGIGIATASVAAARSIDPVASIRNRTGGSLARRIDGVLTHLRDAR